ncbi:MAG TPA: CBS domain-containing protein [Acidimicrobiales bacterium]|nr:CBS domain-containing protein [Acidimicrobiales bacterium]
MRCSPVPAAWRTWSTWPPSTLTDLPLVPGRGSPDDHIQEVMAQMTRTRNRHIPVVHDSQLYGLVSIGDLLKHRLEELELQTNVLRDSYISRH